MALLVIDLGSSSARALLFSDAARLIPDSICSRPLAFTTDAAGQATVDAMRLRQVVEACIDEALTHPAAGVIRAVGMATFAGNWLGLDAASAPCTPVFTYADTRGASEIARLRQRLPGDSAAYHQATGCLLHPAYLPAQYAWLRCQQPPAAANMSSISDIGGYLYRQWFERIAPMSLSLASWSGLLDTARQDWHQGYASALLGGDFPPKLPRLADFDAAQIGLSPTYAARWRALRACPFFLALGDGAAANIGSGAVAAQHIALTVGTTSALRVVKREGRVPPGLWRYLVTADLPLTGGATSEGGNVYQWTLRTLRIADERVEAELRRRPPDAHGLTVLPHLAGERAPGWQAAASGAILGLRPHTRPLDILQAQLESVALRLSLIYDALKTDSAMVMAGGGALQASPAWARMIADALGCPMQLLAEPEVTARGVALLMRQRLDGIALDADPPAVSAVIQAQPARVARMRAARKRQIALYHKLYG